MKVPRLNYLLIAVLSFLLAGQLPARDGKTFNKSFTAKEKLKIELVLGSCFVKKSADDKIHVLVNYTYDDENFEIKVREKEKSLQLQEKIYGENASGDSEWTIHIPDELKIDFECATGDLSLEQVKVEIEGKSGTGDISVVESSGTFDLKSGTGNVSAEGAQGEFRLTSGTGNVIIKNCNGEFDAKSGTGNVEAADIKIVDEAEFKSGTGDSQITDPAGENFDLYVKSGTGDATLVLEETPLEGYFEFEATAPGGDIVCPVGFDNEKTYDRRDDGHTIKSFTRGQSTPRYYISTGTGKAELKK